MDTMTKEQLMDAIYKLDPSYVRMKIDLSKYSVDELVKHYNRKKNAPISRNTNGSKGWYSSYTPSRRVPQERTDGFVEVAPNSSRPKEQVSLTGFDALQKA